MDNYHELIQPFGEICFENEIERWGQSKWEEHFFEHTDFVKKSLLSSTYLIVGRRGSGKSSLIQHILFQDKYPNSDYINFGFAEEYNAELFKIANDLIYPQELKVQKLVQLWDYIIWQIIFKKLSHNKEISRGIHQDCKDPSLTNFIKLVVKGLLNRNEVSHGDDMIEMLNKRGNEKKTICAKEKVLELMSRNALFIVIDSREKYTLNNENEMCITAALIQCASQLCTKYAKSGMHIKVCIADEIFPYIKEQYVTNTLKYVRNTLFMYWSPKDLMRLVSWRLHKYLQHHGFPVAASSSINWSSHEDILEKIWIPHFGQQITNRRGVKEDTFPYLLRHTHLRPRQLIYLCNTIAEIAIEKKEFPKFSELTITQGVLCGEMELANEVINSYSSIYHRVGDIVSKLEGFPMVFEGRQLYIAAKRSAPFWTDGEYSPQEFIKLVVELGIVGRRRSNVSNATAIVTADFEFALRDRLFINEKDTCVIHPLFYSKLNTNRNEPMDHCIYPFPDHPDFDPIRR